MRPKLALFSWVAAALACQLPSVTSGTISCTDGGPACPDGLTCQQAGGGQLLCITPGSTTTTAATSGGGSSGNSAGTTAASTSGTTTTGATTTGATTAGAATTGGSTIGATAVGATTTGGSTGMSGTTTASGSATTSGFANAVVSTLAGNGKSGHVDGTGGPSGTAELDNPIGIAIDPMMAYLYVADYGNNDIRAVLLGASAGSTSTLAGDGTAGFVDGTGGPSGTTKLNGPKGVFAFGGEVYIGDWQNSRVRRSLASTNATDAGWTATLAGNGTAAFADGTGGPSGTAEFKQPYGVAVDSQGNTYVGDDYGNRVRMIAPNGATTTLAGNGTASWADGTGGPSGTAEFQEPRGIAIDSAGNVYVADWGNNRVRVVKPDGTTTTLAGNGTAGLVDGTTGATGTAQLDGPEGVAVDSAGNVYVADSLDNCIREISGGMVTTIAGDGDAGYRDGPALSAAFWAPSDVAIDGQDNLYVADRTNNRIRMITP